MVMAERQEGDEVLHIRDDEAIESETDDKDRDVETPHEQSEGTKVGLIVKCRPSFAPHLNVTKLKYSHAHTPFPPRLFRTPRYIRSIQLISGIRRSTSNGATVFPFSWPRT
jgi:hypothetical protein